MAEIILPHPTGYIFDSARTQQYLMSRGPRALYRSIAHKEVLKATVKETMLYRFLNIVLKQRNEIWRPQYQKFGTCVGQGAKVALDTLAAVRSITQFSNFKGRYSVAGCYAGSRVEVGKQPGAWEGSVGAWVVEFLQKWGGLTLSSINLPEDSLDPDENLAMEWTKSGQGIPAFEETLAKENPVSDVAAITSYDEAAHAINNLSPVIIGNTYIPSGKRDANGFSPISKMGGHFTLFWAVRTDRPGLLYQQSWGETWGSGPTYPNDMPAGSCWLTPSNVNKMIKDGECYALVDILGLAPRFDN